MARFCRIFKRRAGLDGGGTSWPCTYFRPQGADQLELFGEG